jgi:hypothetical protein
MHDLVHLTISAQIIELWNHLTQKRFVTRLKKYDLRFGYTYILFLGLIIQDDSLIFMFEMKLSHICEENALMKDIICISALNSDESHIQQVRLNK